jgi:hypothetical protein
MLLSEVFGVERDTDFGVKGYESLFKVTLNVWGEERLMFKLPCVSAWEPVSQGTLCSVIFAAPAGIIHLPTPLTDEQSDILKAYLTIGYLWMTKDNFGNVVLWETEPSREYGHWSSAGHATRPLKSRECKISNLASSSDLLPYYIGKALGVGE